MIQVINFIRNQWFGIFIILVLLWTSYESSKEVELYKLKLEEIKNQIEIYKEKDRKLQKKIDSLNTADAVVVKEIQTIKEKEYVQIKVVDSMPISELQEFFTDRYPSRSTE
jgi:hypothetical protein